MLPLLFYWTRIMSLNLHCLEILFLQGPDKTTSSAYYPHQSYSAFDGFIWLITPFKSIEQYTAQIRYLPRRKIIHNTGSRKVHCAICHLGMSMGWQFSFIRFLGRYDIIYLQWLALIGMWGKDWSERLFFLVDKTQRKSKDSFLFSSLQISVSKGYTHHW